MEISKHKLFYQLGIITDNNDPRIPEIKRLLKNKTEIEADNWAHDIIVGNKTLDEALYGKRKES